MVKVLIVEDEDSIRMSLMDMLELANHDVIEASDGEAGLQLALKELPDLIISDIMMPVMDGYEFFDAIKQDSTTAHIPFIFLTALADYKDVRAGMNLGADDYLTKPFDYKQLTNAVNTRLNKHAQEEQRRLRRFVQRLVNLQERERSTLAHDIEADLQEPLNGLKMMLTMAKQTHDAALIEAAYTLTDELITKSQDLSVRLMPTMINHLNIISILIWLFEQYSKRFDIKIDFERAGFIPKLNKDEKIAIYRVFDEVLKNIVNHAEAKTVIIRIITKDNRFYTDIRDDGKGFDVQTALDGSTVGLQGIFERITLLNGELNIHSVLNDGTQVTIDLPVDIILKDSEQQVTIKRDTKPQVKPISIANTRILIADHHDIIRHGLQRILNQDDRLEIVAQASNRQEVLKALRQQEIDLVILDLTLDDTSGFEFIKVIKQQAADTNVIAFSNHKQEVYAVEAIRSGANGYLLKESTSLEIMNAIHNVVRGEQYIDETMADAVFEWMLNAQSRTINTANTIDMLTTREREILLLVLDGLTSGEIGDKLMISSRTVEKHRSNFMSKLGLKTPAQLMKFASDSGLFT